MVSAMAHSTGDRVFVLRFAGSIMNLMRHGFLTMVALLCLAAASQPAFAETRTLKLYYVHTGERAAVTYKRNGKYLSDGLKKANVMLRDWRRNETTKMDPKTLDILWQVYKASGSRDYIHVVSGYRSPATNTMLRRTRGGQAEKSQHLLGKAIDFYLPDVKLSKLRALAFKIQGGGVGYYPRSGSPFVHVDSGNVRAWPRMSRGELLALFPDGKTVHLPADGKPLPGYQAALAAYKNGKGASTSIIVDNSSSDEKKPTLWAALFGGGADESDDEADVSTIAAAPPPAKKSVAVAAAKPKSPPPVDIAALQPNALDGGPDASGSGAVASIQPDQNTSAPALDAIASVAPEFTTLPKRDAPVPSAAPRLADEPVEEVQIAVIEPVDPAAIKAAEALAEAEIAAIDATANSNLPSDGPVPTPRPVVEVAALEPEAPAAGVDIASLSADPVDQPQQDELRDAFAPVPESAPGRDVTPQPLMPGELAPEDGAVDVASLPDSGPIPQLREDDLQAEDVPAGGLEVDELSASPAPVVSKPAAKAGAIGANVKTGVKTTGKSAKILTAKLVKKPVASPQIAAPVDPDRFGPSSDKSASNKALTPQKNGKGPRILPDGSTLVSAGKIQP
jgi:uncharacterized protein YcbK (DUF882 family)